MHSRMICGKARQRWKTLCSEASRDSERRASAWIARGWKRCGCAGYTYDSSRIDFTGHPLYGSLDVADFDAVTPGHFVQHGFHEFEVSTLPVLGRRLPVSGGGYLRIAPWAIMGPLIQTYLQSSQLYVLYIHPFELSQRPQPAAAAKLSFPQRLRFGLGRAGVARKLEKLVRLLKHDGFSFVTFRDLCQQSVGQA
jgi:hypothetical protein